MEYILRAGLFDYELADKVINVVLPDINQFEKELHYKIAISFHVDLLNDPRMDLVDVPLKKWERNDSRKDKIYNLLGFQINRIDQAFCNNELQIIDASIQGEQLEAPDMIKIKIEKKEVDADPPRKKNKSKPFKITNVIPSLPFTQETTSKLANERLSRIYNDLMKAIRDKKIMSEILEIEATEDDKELYNAFFKQYWDLWLCTDDQRKTIVNKLIERTEIVFNKHLEKDNSGK
ncbi:hypothetical protein [Paenibacillus piscarius]|uniref:hypothetical protein n=1 Tax=Paenibacillus piscarius TaxID=1089681 RepID=UPI001EE7A3B7|nr:hypothetical protein [Paenibacillus piscarius]